MFGRHDDCGAVGKPSSIKGIHHSFKGMIHEVEGISQDRPGSSAVGEVATSGGPRHVSVGFRHRQLLSCRDALEIHAKDRWRPWVAGAIMAQAVYPVDNGLNLI